MDELVAEKLSLIRDAGEVFGKALNAPSVTGEGVPQTSIALAPPSARNPLLNELNDKIRRGKFSPDPLEPGQNAFWTPSTVTTTTILVREIEEPQPVPA